MRYHLAASDQQCFCILCLLLQLSRQQLGVRSVQIMARLPGDVFSRACRLRLDNGVNEPWTKLVHGEVEARQSLYTMLC